MPKTSNKKKAASGSHTLKKNSRDGKKLKKLLESGKISKGCPPKLVLELYPEFKKYKPDSFRGCLRRIKTDIGFNIRNTAGEYNCD